MVLSMERWSDKVAVVTGASAGCGAAIAEALVKEGLKVVGLARRKEKIEELSEKLKTAKGKLYAVRADITVESSIIDAFKWTQDNVGPVSILINNAGISQPTTLIGGNSEMWRKILDTNVVGLSIATREAVDQMLANKIDGHIVHVNSILGHYVAHIPQVNIYPASKFAVSALTETLRQEFAAIDSNIKITSISPGATNTEFGIASNLERNEDWMKFYETIPKLNSEDVADAVIYVLSTPQHVQVHDVMLRHIKEHV